MSKAKRDARCVYCGGSIEGGVAYLSAGALWLDDSRQNSIHHDQHLAFMHVGFHGTRSDMLDSANIDVVNDRPGGQFDLSFCSLDCLKAWFVQIIDSLQSQIASQQHEQG